MHSVSKCISYLWNLCRLVKSQMDIKIVKLINLINDIAYKLPTVCAFIYKLCINACRTTV